jgi:putative salt-induced outer membrane protein
MTITLHKCSVLKEILLGMLLAVCLSIVTAEVVAQEPTKDRRLKNEAEVAAINTTGNTEVLTLSLRNALTYDFSRNLSGQWNLFALYGEQDHEKQAERYSTDLRGDYMFDSRKYAYLLGGWLRDEFAGYENRYSAGPGFGYKLLGGPKHLLIAELGASLTREEYVTRDSSDFIESRLFGSYEYAFSEGSHFSQSLEYLQDLASGANYKMLSRTALTSALTKILAMRLSYEIRYQNRPVPESLEKTDTILSGSLIINY